MPCAKSVQNCAKLLEEESKFSGDYAKFVKIATLILAGRLLT